MMFGWDRSKLKSLKQLLSFLESSRAQPDRQGCNNNEFGKVFMAT